VDIEGRKAVVFGGTSGIGLATARQLAARRAEVVAASRNPDRAGEVPDGVTLAACDVLDAEAIDELLAGLAPIDILVSSATGGARAIGPFLTMDIDGFRGSFDKLWGYANVVHRGVHHLSQDGTIVLVSGSPARLSQPGLVSLSSVGAAVEAMARSVAPELAPRRLNVVSPGIIDTPMVEVQGPEREEVYRRMTAGNVIPRAGTADEVAAAILFVVENDFVTGTTVDVDGGWLLA
jgi:NAD(P)-dependent dehydrogenase (short-subunit alcohol dehydrogenase family)